MWLMTQQETPDDFVIATGITHSVREFIEVAISCAKLPGTLQDYVEFDPNMIRPSEVDILIGDPTKARKILNWEPKTNFVELVEKMVLADLAIESE
jgi:GDPmannose 4,6-dehydratase